MGGKIEFPPIFIGSGGNKNVTKRTTKPNEIPDFYAKYIKNT